MANFSIFSYLELRASEMCFSSEQLSIFSSKQKKYWPMNFFFFLINKLGTEYPDFVKNMTSYLKKDGKFPTSSQLSLLTRLSHISLCHQGINKNLPFIPHQLHQYQFAFLKVCRGFCGDTSCQKQRRLPFEFSFLHLFYIQIVWNYQATGCLQQPA